MWLLAPKLIGPEQATPPEGAKNPVAQLPAGGAAQSVGSYAEWTRGFSFKKKESVIKCNKIESVFLSAAVFHNLPWWFLFAI